MRYYYTALLFLFVSVSGFTQNLTIDQRVDSLLQLMTLDEKIGQMTQAERGALENQNDITTYGLGCLWCGGGSAPTPNTATAWADMYDGFQQKALQSRLGIPLVYGVDAVHGHNNVMGAVIFPHNIGLGCTRNPELIEAVNAITAREVAATGIDWTFSPCIAVPRDERWGRTYEGFGETPEIQEIMATASVIGLQGDDLGNNETILACAKHYVGDGGTTDGDDQGNTVLNETQLREIHLPGYIDAIEANVGTVMASYSSWNGVKMHGHEYLLTTVLKEELGFEGFVISDWKGVDQINEDYRTAVKRAINAGIDMVMVPDRYIYFISVLKDLVQNNEVSMARIDDAVRRILKQKFLMRLFEEPYTDRTLLPSVGSAAHRDVARQAVRESLVLLHAKNDVLPLQKSGQKILVAGRLANNLGGQCGGWSISWQGSEGNITTGTTILAGMQQLAGSGNIIYSETGTTTQTVDAAVVVIGETPYAEGAGDRTSLNIQESDVNLVKSLKEKNIPVIVVLVSGRPMILGELLPYSDAIIAAWLPGTEGKGVGEVLFGDALPKGKLSHTWPGSMSQVPINVGDANYHPLFAYAHGLEAFPAEGSSELTAYAGILRNSGDQILLALTDTITQLAAALGDFQIKVNGVVQTNINGQLNISSLDPSILEINLTEAVSASGAMISISYSGNGISSDAQNLEVFSDLFVYNNVVDYGAPISVPGKVEAEAYFEMAGVDTENCTDIGGGLNVGWIEPGDYMKYYIEVAGSGDYRLTARIAGFNGGTLHFLFDESLEANVNFTSTNGWQSWQDFNTTVHLEAGTHLMKAFASSDGYNINYFNFVQLTQVDEQQANLTDISIYPNPVESDFTVQFNNRKNQNVRIGLFTSGGKKIQTLFDGQLSVGQNDIPVKIADTLTNGVYFIEIKDAKQRYVKKLVINAR